MTFFIHCVLPIFQGNGKINDDVTHHIRAGGRNGDSPTVVRTTMLYGAKCWPVKNFRVPKMRVAEMRMLRW